jgi:hypothetical protein
MLFVVDVRWRAPVIGTCSNITLGSTFDNFLSAAFKLSCQHFECCVIVRNVLVKEAMVLEWLVIEQKRAGYSPVSSSIANFSSVMLQLIEQFSIYLAGPCNGS